MGDTDSVGADSPQGPRTLRCVLEGEASASLRTSTGSHMRVTDFDLCIRPRLRPTSYPSTHP